MPKKQTKTLRPSDEHFLDERRKVWIRFAEQRWQAFARAHDAGDLPAAVQLGRKVAIELIREEGIDKNLAIDAVETLAGELQKTPDGSVPLEQFTAYVFGATAIGIAIGQLVHPDVLGKGAGHEVLRGGGR